MKGLATLLILGLGLAGCASSDSGEATAQAESEKYFSIGMVKLEAGDFAGAKEALTRSIALDSTNFNAWGVRGTARLRLAEAGEACTDFSTAVLLIESSKDITIEPWKGMYLILSKAYQTNCDGSARVSNSELGFLEDYRGKYPHEVNLFENKALKPRLQAILGDEYKTFLRNFGVETPIEVLNGLVITTGLAPHGGGEEEAILIVDLVVVERCGWLAGR